jgi:succinoglycan biosynthesis transport protein ExoP
VYHNSQSYPESGSATAVIARPSAIDRADLGAAPYVAPVERSIISFEDILGHIIKRWRLALVAATVVAGLLFALMISRTPIYQSDAGLLLRNQDNKVFSFDKFVDNSTHENSIPYILNNHTVGLESQRFREFLDASMSDDQRERFMNPVIKDRNAVGTVIAEAKKAAGDLVKSISSNTSESSVSSQDEKSAVIQKLEQSVHLDVIKETHIIKVSVQHPDRNLAAELANLYCESYVRFLSEQDHEATEAASDFLRQQAEELKQRVGESERQLFTYRKQEGLMEDDERKDITAERVKTMSQELTATQLKLAEAEHYLEQLVAVQKAGRSPIEIDAVASDPVIAKLRDDLAVKGKERAAIASRYGSKHPTRIETENSYQALQASLQNAAMRAVSEIRNRAALYRRQATDLNDRLAAAEKEVFGVGEKNIELTMLRKQLEADRALYESIALRLNEASVSSRFNEMSNLRIADTAVPAAKASSPNLPLSAIIAALVFSCVFTGLPVGLGFAQDAVSSQWFQRVRHSAASYRLARIPRFEGGGEQQVLREALGGFVDSPDPELVRLVNEIEIASPRAKRTLLISSASQGEGKSFMSAALANLFAAQGKRTLVIDCNFRRPSLYQWMNKGEKAPSLWNWLESDGSVSLDENDLRCGTLPIFALHAGCKSDAPSELLARETFQSLISHAERAFDCLIIDAPEIEDAPEIFNLVRHSTDVLLVWDRKKSTKRKLASVMSRLERISRTSCLLGAVENRSA